mgnify:CR=1 FL=1
MIKVNVISEENSWSKKLKKKEIFFNKLCRNFPDKFRFDNKQVQQKFGRDYKFAYQPVLEMNAYWEQHPLYNVLQDEFYSSSIRLFHNGSLKSGSRWYGGWTLVSPDQRFSLTIDDQPIVNIGINAMILALLTSLTGKPMSMIGTFEDVYQAVVFQLAGVNNAREKVKKVKKLFREGQ